MSSMSKEEALRLVNSHHWMHSFEIVPGVVTPGVWGHTNSADLFDRVYRIPKNLKGQRALDIGAPNREHSSDLDVPRIYRHRHTLPAKLHPIL